MAVEVWERYELEEVGAALSWRKAIVTFARDDAAHARGCLVF
jgi:hypothetical protein